MKAQILGIQLNIKEKFANGKTYDGHKLTYKPEPYAGKEKDPVEKFVFGNSDFAKYVQKAQVGDWVEIVFEKNGKYSNPVSMSTIAPPVEGERPTRASGSSQNTTTDERIARAVALKEASVLVGTLVGQGAYTAANLKKREYMVEQIIQTAREFLPFLQDNESLEAVVGMPVAGQAVNQDNFED